MITKIWGSLDPKIPVGSQGRLGPPQWRTVKTNRSQACLQHIFLLLLGLTTPYMCLSTKCGYRDLAARGAILKLAEVHGEVRDMLRAEGLQERMEGVEQRVGVAALVAS